MSSDTIEIVVTASRIYGAINYSTFAPWDAYWKTLPTTQQDNQWLYGPYPLHAVDYTSQNHLKKFVITATIETFNEMFEDLLADLQFRDPGTIIDMGQGFTMTVGTLIDKLKSLQFRVYDKSFSGPGYGGANYGDRVEIQYTALAGYVSRGQNGTNYGFNYLVLHEIAHNTQFGIESRSWAWNSYLDAGSVGFFGKDNGFFQMQERYANSIARSIAGALGKVITSPNEPGFPPHGFY